MMAWTTHHFITTGGGFPTKSVLHGRSGLRQLAKDNGYILRRMWVIYTNSKHVNAE